MATNKDDQITQTEQNILNKSQDTDFKVLAIEILGYDPTASTLNRVKVNASGELVTATTPDGIGSNGSVTLTNADTAYAVPATASTKDHILVLYNGSAYDMFWGYQNTNANGILLPANGRVTLDLGANQQVYLYCATAAQTITYTYKEHS